MAQTRYNSNSIVDTLSKAGQASDYASRAKLAGSLGITGYTGTASQNTDLIRRYTSNTTPTPVAPVTPTAPTAPVVTDPTKTTTTPTATRVKTPYDLAAAEADAKRTTEFTDSDANAIREAKRAQSQGAIDAINTLFNTKREDQVVENKNNTGRTRSLGSSAGLNGSGRGLAMKTNTETYNKKQLDSVEAQRNAEIQAIYGKIDERASQEIEARRAEAKGNMEAHLNFLKENRDNAVKDVENLGKYGQTLDNLDPKDVEDLMRQTGKTRLELDSLVEANLPDDMKVQWTSVTAPDANGNAVLTKVGINPRTGKSEKKTYDMGIPYKDIQKLDVKEVDGVLVGFDPVTKQVTNLTKPSEKAQLDLENKRLQNEILRTEMTTESTGIPEKTLTKIQASPEYKTINGILPAIQAIKNYKDAVDKYGSYEAFNGAGKGVKASTYGNAIAAWKTLAGLGALSGADFGLAENVIPEGGKLFARNSKQAAQLDEAIKNAISQADILTKRLSQNYPVASNTLNQQLNDIKTIGGVAAPAANEDQELLDQGYTQQQINDLKSGALGN